jgi:hypothetical protein
MGVRPDAASELDFLDKGGKTRLAVHIQPDGAPTLLLQDHKGGVRAALGLAGGDGRPRIGLAVDPSGSAVVGLMDKDGGTRASMGLAAGGEASLGLRDRAGKTRIGMSLDGLGAPGMTLFDAGAPRGSPWRCTPGAGRVSASSAEARRPGSSWRSSPMACQS